jgi:hypothetical protein
VSRHKPIDISSLSRWEAMDLMGTCSLLAATGQWGTLAEALGMTEDLAENLTMDEVVECLTVRMKIVADRAKVEWTT